VKQRRLHKESQPLEWLDRVIEEIRSLILRSSHETISKGKLNRREPARATRQQQQKQQGSGADGQLQKIVWDLGGFQQSWEAHE
jgi:hypothetical protein